MVEELFVSVHLDLCFQGKTTIMLILKEYIQIQPKFQYAC